MMAKKVPQATFKRSDQLYAEVAPLIPLPATSSQTFTYQIPINSNGKVALYGRVSIPFGKRHVEGVVLKIHEFRVPYPTKDLVPSTKDILTTEQVVLAQWIANTMHGGLGFTLRLFFSRGSQTKVRITKENKLMFKKLAGQVGVLIIGDDKKRWDNLVELAKNAANQDEQTVIIVPEKWLIKGIEGVMKSSFPPSRVVSVHSDLSAHVEADNWQKVSTGEALIIIGTQKSLFLPYHKLGLVILEEENFHTHKLWDAYPRLDNRLVAEQLAKIHDCYLVFSSSVPSLSLYKKIKDGTVAVLRNTPLILKPKIIGLTFTDRKKHLLLPEELMSQMKEWVKRGEKIFILHNRRGLWTTVLCRSCHKVLRCPICNLSLTVSGKNVCCQHCGTKEKMPATCPTCHKKTLATFGAGTEKMAEILGRNLNREIMMIDAAAIAGKKGAALKKIFNKKQAPIIVGTTAALRFLDHQIIDRVVFMNPERSLLYPDFRSAERTAYLLLRLQKLLSPGKSVVLATSHQRTVTEELMDDVEKIYDRQLAERRRLKYPPYTDMVLLTFQSSNLAGARKKAVIIRNKISKLLPSKAVMRGPFQSFITTRRGNVEVHLLLTGELAELAKIYSRLPIDVVDVWPERVL